MRNYRQHEESSHGLHRAISRKLLEWSEKKRENISQYSRPTQREFKPRPVKHEVGVQSENVSGMSVRNCHYSLRNNPDERSSHLLRGGNMKSRRLQSDLTRGNFHVSCRDIRSYLRSARKLRSHKSNLLSMI